MTGNKSVDVERLMVGDEKVFQTLFIDYYPALVSLKFVMEQLQVI